MGNTNIKPTEKTTKPRIKVKICGLCHTQFTTRLFDFNVICPPCHKKLIDLDRRYYSVISFR